MAEVVGWRIVKEKHAGTAFSGDGARTFEGRWNSAGVAIVYCSEHLSLAALEILVHAQPVTITDNFRAFRVSWDETLMVAIDRARLGKDWNANPPGTASKTVGDRWVKTSRSAVLVVPSVVVPLERTFLLNPKHSDFAQIRIESTGRFVLDSRLKA
ncbi:MAG: RES family NAD+ phosphorylase [Chthoniobacterales bacterium]